MESCLVCLENTNESEGNIHVNSIKWEELNIKNLIEKHLWPLPVAASSCICITCLKELHGFHDFYIRIENAHRNFGVVLKIENPNESFSPSEYSIQETVLPDIVKEEFNGLRNEPEEELWDDDDDAPLMTTNEFKRPATETLLEEYVPTSKSTRSNKRYGELVNTTTGKEPEAKDPNNDVNKTETPRQFRSLQEKNVYLSKNFNPICIICQKPMENFQVLCKHFVEEHHQLTSTLRSSLF